MGDILAVLSLITKRPGVNHVCGGLVGRRENKWGSSDSGRETNLDFEQLL